MIRAAPAMQVRQNLGELLNEVRYRHDRVMITKAGKPVAALIDMPLFERIRKLDEEFEQISNELADTFARVPEDEGTSLLDEAVATARRKQ
jgi:prevent-host-death family protein